MIRVKVNLSNGKTVIEAQGHSGDAPKGRSIVCAGVSAILQTAVLGLQSLAESYPDDVVVEVEEAR